MWSRTSSAACSQALGIGQVQFLPPRRAADLPPVGPNTSFLLAQPFLADTARALEERGATRLAAPFPLGVEGTTAWLEAAANAWQVDPAPFRSVTGPGAASARAAPWRATELNWPASGIFFFPGLRSSKCRWRASCRASSSMQLVEVGTPYLHRAASRRRNSSCCRAASR